MLEKKRDEMAEMLREVGLKPIIPDGGFFMLADTSPLGEGACVCEKGLAAQQPADQLYTSIMLYSSTNPLLRDYGH